MKLYIDYNDGKGEQELNSLHPYSEALSFTPDSASIERETTTMQRRNGVVLTQHPREIVYKERKVTVEIYLQALNHSNFYMYRRELYAIFCRQLPYYISTDLLPGMRFLVTCDGNFSIAKDKEKTYKSLSIEFVNINGLAESKCTSMTAQNPYVDSWGFNLGMKEKQLTYKDYQIENKQKFKIFNPGEARVNPMEHDYNVVLYAEGKGITIINNSNNEQLKIEESLKKSQKVEFIRQYVVNDKTHIKKSGRIPGLEPGWNEFEVKNTSDFKLIFDTRFYYV
ncbi:phage tail family protein [Bacillus velezensis]|uniref:phage tail domain-containing protein n=1 Tax=Bacillus velezensis TaxID=492670 RepID=UPI00059DF7A8|nr:phage tail domain-containing protein [Bacillus velezensis]PKF84193.1 phage tail family protein [Bacillus velezensis]WPB68500.1 phage tail family protein [Bacillus velezensis]